MDGYFHGWFDWAEFLLVDGGVCGGHGIVTVSHMDELVAPPEDYQACTDVNCERGDDNDPDGTVESGDA